MKETGTPKARLDALADEFYVAMLTADPVHAHTVGEYDYAGAWQDVSLGFEQQRQGELKSFAERAEMIDPARLEAKDRLSREILISESSRLAGLVAVAMPEFIVDPIMGAQANAARIITSLGIPTGDVADRLLRTVGSLAQHYRVLAGRLREGTAAGRTASRCSAEMTLAQLDHLVSTPIEHDELLKIPRLPGGVDEEKWRTELKRIVGDEMRTALVEYAGVLREFVLPAARDDEHVGLCWLADGEEHHANALRYYTTSDINAREIHQLGLELLAGLNEEYARLGFEVFGVRNAAEIHGRMRTDKAYRIRSAEHLLEIASAANDRAWTAMPNWFEVSPEAPCTVNSAENGLKAFYMQGSRDGARTGAMFFNSSQPQEWGVFDVESTTFHEGIPGHHMQFTVAGGLTDLPEFRREIYVHSYSEGWGLYSERLADEMGLYSGPIDRLGMIAADSMRACRMVIDTGIHSLGWSRERAIAFMLEHTPLSRGIVSSEIDRYIIDPGQSPSYMLGRLAIQRARKEASARQGDVFDVRRFHTVVLSSGSVPTDVLARIVESEFPTKSKEKNQ